jgi:hypothetical protein
VERTDTILGTIVDPGSTETADCVEEMFFWETRSDYLAVLG